MQYAPETVKGYHGCSREAAARLLAGEGFVVSNNAYDWLGRGVYFWEYAPVRALEWARARYGQEAAVLEATIRLGNCLNLLDTRHQPNISQVFSTLISSLDRENIPRPANTRRGAHFLDRWIIDEYCFLVEQLQDTEPFETVRGCFPEGEPLYEGSKLFSKTHVQIAVRNPRCISSIALITSEQTDQQPRG